MKKIINLAVATVILAAALSSGCTDPDPEKKSVKHGRRAFFHSTPPIEHLEGTTWKLVAYFSPNRDTLKIFEPHYYWQGRLTYWFEFDTDSTAFGKTLINTLEVHLRAHISPNNPIGVAGFANTFEDEPLFWNLLAAHNKNWRWDFNGYDEFKFINEENNYLLFTPFPSAW